MASLLSQEQVLHMKVANLNELCISQMQFHTLDAGKHQAQKSTIWTFCMLQVVLI